ncbi:MAG: hypothetical protein AMJ53_13575 [Gammaproteobacteria bacterium SG8_11]|nr:MAG: hypothetical protein AMJ53_13575 [Gammaproteobacteria bacterium SG8_11]
MENSRIFRIFIKSLIILGFGLTGCESTPSIPDPETASGVYVHSGFEYYRWEDGLRLMIWHDGIDHLSCSSSTNGYYEIECFGMLIGNRTFAWHLETNDGNTAQFSIDDHLLDLDEGNLFIIQSSGKDTEVKQLKRDLSDVQADAGSVTEFGLSDPDILEFIQSSSEVRDHISDCISSTISQDGSNSPDGDKAQKTLISFFDLLHDGDYGSAAALYGGDYEVIRNHNPGIPPYDHAALFRNACTINGAQCLRVHKVNFLEQPSPAEFHFSVQFANEDGYLFWRGPCCGDDRPEMQRQDEYVYTVRLECTGSYLVMEMPVYLP